MSHLIETEIQEIKNFISQQQIAQKNILTLNEAATFTSLSKSYLYKKTSCRQIPFYKLDGKLIYFKKIELEEWLLSNRVSPVNQLEFSLNSKKNI
jgi:excisionase family DNA binding protein